MILYYKLGYWQWWGLVVMESGWGCSLIPRPLQLLIIVVLRLTKLFFISVSFESGYHWSYWPCSVRNVCDIVHVSWSTNRQTGEYNHLIASKIRCCCCYYFCCCCYFVVVVIVVVVIVVVVVVVVGLQAHLNYCSSQEPSQLCPCWHTILWKQ